MYINELVRERRKALGMTMTELAAACKAHYVTIVRLETTPYPPSLGMFGRLCDVLQLDPAEAIASIDRTARKGSRDA